MKNLKLKIPPDAVLLITAFLMWTVTLFVPSYSLPFAVRAMAGAILAVTGLLIVQAAGISFRRARTTVDPKKPEQATTLIETGVYRFTRNPIYLGMTIVLTGWAVFLLNLLSLALVSVFVIYITRFQIIPEERSLLARFGEKYSSYRSRVRRWL